MNKKYFPSKIICMTEESVEFFHAIDRSDVIAGISVYAVRPKDVKKMHPVISSFTHANSKKIINLNPDLIIGFSDIQKEIAKDLIDAGLNVFISNQRSLEDILKYLNQLGSLIGEPQRTQKFIERLEAKILWAKNISGQFQVRPRVYIEEWDEPRIGGIRWFSELIQLCGGEDIFFEMSQRGIKAKDRFISDAEVIKANPDIILACWCGKSVDIQSIKDRTGYSEISAVKKNQIIELAPEIFLQPGPALILDGIDQLISLFLKYQSK